MGRGGIILFFFFNLRNRSNIIIIIICVRCVLPGPFGHNERCTLSNRIDQCNLLPMSDRNTRIIIPTLNCYILSDENFIMVMILLYVSSGITVQIVLFNIVVVCL